MRVLSLCHAEGTVITAKMPNANLTFCPNWQVPTLTKICDLYLIMKWCKISQQVWHLVIKNLFERRLSDKLAVQSYYRKRQLKVLKFEAFHRLAAVLEMVNDEDEVTTLGQFWKENLRLRFNLVHCAVALEYFTCHYHDPGQHFDSFHSS